MALTVDAEHPDRSRCAPGNCERILEALDEAGIRATFPVQHAATPTAPTPGGRAVDTPTAQGTRFWPLERGKDGVTLSRSGQYALGGTQGNQRCDPFRSPPSAGLGKG